MKFQISNKILGADIHAYPKFPFYAAFTIHYTTVTQANYFVIVNITGITDDGFSGRVMELGTDNSEHTLGEHLDIWGGANLKYWAIAYPAKPIRRRQLET